MGFMNVNFFISSVSTSSSGPLLSEPSTLEHRLTSCVSCINTNRWGHFALAPPLHYTGLMRLLHRHSFIVSAPATWDNMRAPISYSGTLDTFKTASKTHLFNSVYMPRHWQPSIGTSDSLFRDIWRQLNKSVLIDWLVWCVLSTLVVQLVPSISLSLSLCVCMRDRNDNWPRHLAWRFILTCHVRRSRSMGGKCSFMIEKLK